MAFSFKTYANNSTSSTIDMSGNPPAAGDVGICWSIADSTSESGSGPGSGWTQIGGAWTVCNSSDGQTMGVWIKNAVFAGGETTISMTTTTSCMNGAMAISGVDQTTFQDVTAVISNSTVMSSTPATITGAITPVTNGSLLLALFGADNNSSVDDTFTFSDSNGLTWTTQADHVSGARNAGVGTATQTGAANTTVTGSASLPSGTAAKTMYVLALRNASPPAAGPTINTQPTNQSVSQPNAATFTVAATSSGGALAYQWQRSTNGGSTWNNVVTGSGGTTASYTTGPTSATGGTDNSGDVYRVQVSDSNGSVNSNAATLSVTIPPPPSFYLSTDLYF